MPTLKSSSSALSELDGVDPMLTIQLTALNRRAIRLYQAIELMLLSLLIRLIFQRRNTNGIGFGEGPKLFIGLFSSTEMNLNGIGAVLNCGRPLVPVRAGATSGLEIC